MSNAVLPHKLRRIICLILVSALPLSLAGCVMQLPAETFPNITDSTTESTSNSLPENATVPTNQAPSANLDPWNEHTEVWGVSQACTVTNAIGAVTYTCNIPDDCYIIDDDQDTIYVRTNDERVLLIGSPNADYPDVAVLDDVFEVYLDNIAAEIAAARFDTYTDYQLVIEHQEIVEINEKEMLKVRGSMTYVEYGDTRDWTFIGYATKLSNGAYAYWLATYYTGNDYVGLKRIVDNMANSFREE